MIKRFNITVLDGHCLAAMSAHGEGSYVRYADIADLLEEKTLEQHRAEFEEWAKSVELHLGRVSSRDLYISNETYFAWIAWKAARGVTE